MTGRVESVVIVGRDAAAWLTALGLQRALGASGIRIEVVELPSNLEPVDAFSAVPSLAGLHRLLGLDDGEVLARCAGVPVLGQRFVDWSRSEPPFVHGYDRHRPSVGATDFLQFWVKARQEGLRVAWEDFSIAAAAAKQGRIAPDRGDPEALASISPGCHLDASAYVGLVRGRALAMGVGRRQATVVEASRDGDRIVEIVLDGSERVCADLFVDASGAEAMLLGAQPGAEFESWSGWLGCDRLLAASAPALNLLPAYSQVTAFESGWVGLFPLQGRTAVLGAFRSDGGDDAEIARTALAAAGMPVAGDAVVTPFHAGAQRRPWIGNCVAIGDAAVALEPLDAVQLHLIHVGLSHLIALFPVDAQEMPEAMSYNAAILSHAVNVRDFQIAHYRLNGRGGEPFWDGPRDAGGPETLDAKLSLFASRGQVATYDDESFEPQNWAAIFIGHGVLPRSYDHLVDDLPRGEQIERLQRLLRLIADEVNQMPSVNDYLAGGPAAAEPRPAGLF